MRILVDSHVFLWAMISPAKLSGKARAALVSEQHEIFLSAVSFWEISLKFSLGKLDLQGVTPGQLPGVAEEAGFMVVPLEPRIASSFFQLPKLGHKDPFDRMLVWQAIQGGLTLMSKDPEMKAYAPHGLKLLW